MASQSSRKSFRVQISYTTTLLLILLCICHTSSRQEVRAAEQQVDETNGTCGLDELNHSLLIECDDTAKCRDPQTETNSHEDQPIWPSSSNEVLHLFSSRSGGRFKLAHLERHNRQISEQMQLFDINSTLAVKTKLPAEHTRQVHGIGGTLDFDKLANAMESNSFDSSYGRILNDLFGDSPSGTRLNLLRLSIGPNIMKKHNLTDVMVNLDRASKSQVRFIFDVDKTTNIQELEDLMLIMIA